MEFAPAPAARAVRTQICEYLFMQLDELAGHVTLIHREGTGR